MVKFPNQHQFLSNLLKTYSKYLPKPEFKDIESRPQQIEDISPELLLEMKKCTLDALNKGIPEILEDNIRLEKYFPFSDAVASQIIGKIDINISMVIKVGNSKLKEQFDYIENQKPQYKKLYPLILGKSEHNDKCAYLMEFLNEYISLHDMIFVENEISTEEIKMAIDCIFPYNFQFVSQKRSYIKLQGYGGKGSAQGMRNERSEWSIP